MVAHTQSVALRVVEVPQAGREGEGHLARLEDREEGSIRPDEIRVELRMLLGAEARRHHHRHDEAERGNNEAVAHLWQCNPERHTADIADTEEERRQPGHNSRSSWPPGGHHPLEEAR